MGSTSRLGIRIDSRNGVAHVSLDGEIDMSTVPVLESHLAPLESDGVATIMLDLRDLAFTDSMGIHAFLAVRKRVTVSGRRLILVGATPAVRRVFDLTGTQDLLDDVHPVQRPGGAIAGIGEEAREGQALTSSPWR